MDEIHARRDQSDADVVYLALSFQSGGDAALPCTVRTAVRI